MTSNEGLLTKMASEGLYSRTPKREALWAVIDQGSVSAGNFLTSLIVARYLSSEDYGTFSLLFLALLSLNTLHSSLVIYPLTLNVARNPNQNGSDSIGSALLHTIGVWVLSLIVLVALLERLARLDTFFSMAIAMLAWQLQEVARRSLIASTKVKAAILPDIVSYIGQSMLLLFLRPQSLNAIFFYIAGTSTAAMTWQLAILRPSLNNSFDSTKVSASWKLGKYSLVANILNMGLLQYPSWALDYFNGRSAVASYQSLANLIGITNPILFSMSNILIPNIARASIEGKQAARRVLYKHGVLFGTFLVPVFVILGLFPNQVMNMAYGHTSPYLSLAPLLRIFTITSVLLYLATLIGAYEGGLGRPKTYMYCQMAGFAALLTGGTLLIYRCNVRGAVFAGAIVAAVRMTAYYLLSRRADRDTQRGQSSI